MNSRKSISVEKKMKVPSWLGSQEIKTCVIIGDVLNGRVWLKLSQPLNALVYYINIADLWKIACHLGA